MKRQAVGLLGLQALQRTVNGRHPSLIRQLLGHRGLLLPLKDALDPDSRNPRGKDLKGTITVEFRKAIYCTGHRWVSSHVVACDGITEDQPCGEDILYQMNMRIQTLCFAAVWCWHCRIQACQSTKVANDGEPMFGMLSQNFPEAVNGPVPGTEEIVYNAEKAFPLSLKVRIEKGFLRDTGRRVDQGFYTGLPVVEVLF